MNAINEELKLDESDDDNDDDDDDDDDKYDNEIDYPFKC